MSSNTSLELVDEETLNEFDDVYYWYRGKAGIPLDREDEIRERFKKGLEFAHQLVVLKNKAQAYTKVYGECANPTNEATKLLTTQWMSMIMDKVQDAQYALFYDHRLKVLDEALDESLNGSGRTKIDAMKLFLEHTKKPEVQKFEVTHTHEVGDSLADKLEDTLKLLGSQNKIITPQGEVIDAVLLEE